MAGRVETVRLDPVRAPPNATASVPRIRDWEQGRSKPDGAVRAYLLVIQREPEAVNRALAA